MARAHLLTMGLLFALAGASPAAARADLRPLAEPAGDDAGLALSRYLGVAIPRSAKERGTSELKRGARLLKDGDSPGAVQAFVRSAELLPSLADWAFCLAADAAAVTGDTAAVRRFLDRSEQGLAEEWGWRARVRALRRAGDVASAVRLAEAAAGSLQDPARRAEAWKMAADVRLLAGDTAGARAPLVKAVQQAPLAAAAVDAARLLSQLRGLTPQEHLEIGRLYLRHGNLVRGVGGIDAYLASGRATPQERAELQLDIGRALFRTGDFQGAERRLLPLRSAPPPIAAEALFLAGRAQYRQGAEARARATFQSVVSQFSGQPAAIDALFLLADLDHDSGDMASASARYRQLLNTGSRHDRVALAALRLGSLAYMKGEYSAAARIFQQYLDAEPAGVRCSGVCYWAARTQARLGDSARAGAWYRKTWEADPTSYYGLRAGDEIGASLWDASGDVEPAATEAVAKEAEVAEWRLEVLASLELDGATILETERLRQHFARRPAGLYEWADVLHRTGRTSSAIRLGRELQREQGRWDPRLLRIVYPMPHRDLIVREARARSVDPYLAAALIRQESMFNPRAVSGAGAVGLMQVMPATGKVIARRLGVKGFTTGMLKTPETNVRLGMTHLADLLRQYDGRITDVLVAYNAGSGRLARWRSFPEYRDPDVFTERIPFEETREYVRIVQQNTRIYRALYGGAGSSVAAP